MWWLAWIALAVFAAVWPFIVTEFKLDILRRNGHLPPKYVPETKPLLSLVEPVQQAQTPPATALLSLPAPNGPRAVTDDGAASTPVSKKRSAPHHLKLVADNGPVRKRS